LPMEFRNERTFGISVLLIVTACRQEFEPFTVWSSPWWGGRMFEGPLSRLKILAVAIHVFVIVRHRCGVFERERMIEQHRPCFVFVERWAISQVKPSIAAPTLSETTRAAAGHDRTARVAGSPKRCFPALALMEKFITRVDPHIGTSNP